VDDIGAVMVIAIFYTKTISILALGLAAAGFAVLYFFNLIGVRRVPIYVLLGAGIWLAVLKSGVHPTVAGVLLGLLTPASAWFGDRALRDLLTEAYHRWQQVDRAAVPHADLRAMRRLENTARESIAPLQRLEMALHPWVAFGIMPLFALANAGVAIDFSGITNAVALAVASGLFVGKPVGIVLFSAGAVRLGLARLPQGVDGKVLVGAGFLAGIGFTMSLFIASLALADEQLLAAKVGTLTGSALSVVLGMILLLSFLPRQPRQEVG
jgi:NhaA family Na+:H+ antiporter